MSNLKNKIMRLIYIALSTCIIFIGKVKAALPVRPTSTTTIAPMNTTRLNNILNTMGNQNSTTTGPDFGIMIWNGMMVYQDAIGQIVWVIFFSIPFIMMWIVNADTTLPGIVGIMFSLYIFLKLPSQYMLFGIGAIIISIVAVIYGLYHRTW